jgi:hypothetical protein
MVSLCTIFIGPILHNHIMCWTIICEYISMYWTTYLLYVGYIVYYLFVLNIIKNI